ncbi:MAG: potassium channel family protein, partial [Bacteroidota bacterium]
MIHINRIPSTVLSLRTARYLLLGIILVGTLGFRLIEHYGWIDSLYMAVITISTVGFGELEPLSQAGRLFVSFYVIINVAVFAYVLASFSYYVIEGKVFESMHEAQVRRAIGKLSGHAIVCGFGRYGQEIVTHFRRHDMPFVIVELDEEKIEHLRHEGKAPLYVIGDGTQDEVLQEAGIERASSLISALSDDSENLFIVLSAKELNPHLRVISRAHDPRSRKKLLRAGASHVIMPEQIGGYYMATLISKPGAVEFFSFLS